MSLFENFLTESLIARGAAILDARQTAREVASDCADDPDYLRAFAGHFPQELAARHG